MEGSGAAWSAGLRRGAEAELDGWLAFALDAADTADAMSMGAYRREIEVRAKADGSFVTEADQAIERLVRERIGSAYPDHRIIGEEYGADGGQARCRWFVDPIDGTHNFIRGIPLFGTLLALECEGELQVGVVSAPAMGRRWWARRGGGAWVREPGLHAPRRLAVSTVDRLADAQLLYRSLLDLRATRVWDGFEEVAAEVWRERGFGDFWGHMLVAEGAAEVMIEGDLSPWDIAGPWVVVEEAGGRTSDFDGRRDVFTGEGYSSNGLLHDSVLQRLRRRTGDAGGGRHATP